MANRFSEGQRLAALKTTESEARDRHKIQEWESTQKCWSGTGSKHVDSHSLQNAVDIVDSNAEFLGGGAHGVVHKILYGGILMARKTIDRSNLHNAKTLDELREEAKIMEKMDHRHIVTLIGTYTHEDNRFLNILTYPVAVCDLEQFMDDFEQLRGGNFEDVEKISGRVMGLGYCEMKDDDYRNVKNRSLLLTNMAINLGETLGCVTDAIEYVHEHNIRHQDLKPRNILLCPGKVYITDFGISKVMTPGTTTEDDPRVGYASPEISNPKAQPQSPGAVDVYSLGCIFLNAVGLPPGFPRWRCQDVLASDSTDREDAVEDIIEEIKPMLLCTGIADSNDHTLKTKHLLGLIKDMLMNDPDGRPDVKTVNQQLHILGGLDQVYHGKCCWKGNAYMTALLDTELAEWDAAEHEKFEEARMKFNWSLEQKARVARENQTLLFEVDRLRVEVETLKDAQRRAP